MYVVGLDLSGPSNTKDTACAVFIQTPNRLVLKTKYLGLTDPDIVEIVQGLASDSAVVLGIDAPLSYNPGGGDRPGDRQLRIKLKEEGDSATAVMPPTLNRMVYLTLRGISLARMLDRTARIVEVHPGAAMALRGADFDAVRQFKKEMSARKTLLAWLDDQGVGGITLSENPADHEIAAYAAALATWDWDKNESSWLHPAEPPFHPYDFAC